ncbi:DUF72 domain-containing protein [Ohtaekwangia sp.]|uniref:DUF72 domain-containing protein n=1 Tax=Ohtaekwangia sp. TaxID=2066019 RepID=UPI002FDE4D24
MEWKIGCSGFSYKEWKGIFYPTTLPQRKWFEYYCEWFNTVELNVTFYRFPRVADLAGWYKRSPQNFVFAVKAPRVITHLKRFKDTGNDLQLFYNTVRDGLGDKLGCILFQLHPAIIYSESMLSRILESLDYAFVNVIEFRHESWWRNDVIQAFRQHHVCWCGISYPQLPEDVYHTAPVVYYRFHGVPQLYHSSYDAAFMKQIGDRIKNFQGVKQAYLYFNNTASGNAVTNAGNFQDMFSAGQNLFPVS